MTDVPAGEEALGLVEGPARPVIETESAGDLDTSATRPTRSADEAWLSSRRRSSAGAAGVSRPEPRDLDTSATQTTRSAADQADPEATAGRVPAQPAYRDQNPRISIRPLHGLLDRWRTSSRNQPRNQSPGISIRPLRGLLDRRVNADTSPVECGPAGVSRPTTPEGGAAYSIGGDGRFT